MQHTKGNKMAEVYYELFDDVKDVISNFEAPADALDNATVHFAEYVDENYEGDAIVIFTKGGKLFEVNGSHCSCFGLEGQWKPEETSWEAIGMRGDDRLKALAEEYLAKK